MDNAAKATEPTPNATILDDDDRAAWAQLCKMMLMIWKGVALNTMFLAGDSEDLEAWRQLTKKYESKMRTRFAGQLMSILSYSFQGDATERITAWGDEVVAISRAIAVAQSQHPLTYSFFFLLSLFLTCIFF